MNLPEQIMYKCDNCKDVVDLSTVKVEKEMYKFEGKQSMWLTHFDCPNCKETIFCQIDNVETNAVLNEVSALLAKIVRCRQSGHKISKKLQSKYNRSTEKLKRLRYDLLKEYNNCWFEDESKHTFKVKFASVRFDG